MKNITSSLNLNNSEYCHFSPVLSFFNLFGITETNLLKNILFECVSSEQPNSPNM